jgi:NADH:ubiquinone oxidoreductase subunit 3 (subunit A)
MDAGACNDYQIWTIDSYMNLDGGWKGPYPGTCCIISLTTVINTNYSATGYSTATQPNYNIDSQPLTAVQGQAFWGTGPIGSQNPYTDITNVNDCQALCSSTSNCTGATFNPSSDGQAKCWLRTGDGKPIPSLPTDYAIVPKAVQLLSTVDQINTQLMAVNELILKDATKEQPIFNGEAYSRKNNTQELIANYENLQKERKKIRDEIKRYETLDAAEVEGNININKNYYSFLLLIVLAGIIIYVLFKVSRVFSSQSNIFSSVQQGGGLFYTDTDTNKYIYYLIFAIIILILLVIYYQKIIQTTTSAASTTSNISASIIRTATAGLTDGKVFNFN